MPVNLCQTTSLVAPLAASQVTSRPQCKHSAPPLLSLPGMQTELAPQARSVAAPHTWNSLPSDIKLLLHCTHL